MSSIDHHGQPEEDDLDPQETVMAEILRQEARHADMQRRVRELRPLAKESSSPFTAQVLENVLKEQSELSSRINILLCDWRALALESVQGRYQTPNAQLGALHKMEAAQRKQMMSMLKKKEDNAGPVTYNAELYRASHKKTPHR